MSRAEHTVLFSGPALSLGLAPGQVCSRGAERDPSALMNRAVVGRGKEVLGIPGFLIVKIDCPLPALLFPVLFLPGCWRNGRGRLLPSRLSFYGHEDLKLIFLY